MAGWRKTEPLAFFFQLRLNLLDKRDIQELRLSAAILLTIFGKNLLLTQTVFCSWACPFF